MNAHEPTTPFNGVDGANPYLLVSIDGTAEHWAYATFNAVNCSNHPCSSAMEIDPIPYAEPGDYYSNSTLVGTQANPFNIIGSLYAVVEHQSQWATRTANGIQEWGTFSKPVTLFGTTKYMYVKRM